MTPTPCASTSPPMSAGLARSRRARVEAAVALRLSPPDDPRMATKQDTTSWGWGWTGREGGWCVVCLAHAARFRGEGKAPAAPHAKAPPTKLKSTPPTHRRRKRRRPLPALAAYVLNRLCRVVGAYLVLPRLEQPHHAGERGRGYAPRGRHVGHAARAAVLLLRGYVEQQLPQRGHHPDRFGVVFWVRGRAVRRIPRPRARATARRRVLRRTVMGRALAHAGARGRRAARRAAPSAPPPHTPTSAARARSCPSAPLSVSPPPAWQPAPRR